MRRLHLGPLLAFLLAAFAWRADALTGTATTIDQTDNPRLPAIEKPFVVFQTGYSDATGIAYVDLRDGSTHTLEPGSAPAIGGGRMAYLCKRGGMSAICVYDPSNFSTAVKAMSTSEVTVAWPSIGSQWLAWVEYTADGRSTVKIASLTTPGTVTVRTLPSAAGMSDGPITRGSHVLYTDTGTDGSLWMRLYDAASGTTITLGNTTPTAAGLRLYDLDLQHVVWTSFSGTLVTDFSGHQLGMVSTRSQVQAISGEWVALRGFDDANHLDLWRWTTNEYYRANVPSVNGLTPDHMDLDGTTVALTETDFTGDTNALLRFDFTPPTRPPVVFSDNFDSCTSSTDLGPNWDVEGIWYCRSGRARGENSNDRLALAKTQMLGDTEIEALVQLNSSDGSGVAVRGSNPPEYVVRLLKAGRVELDRYDGANFTELASYPMTVLDTVSYTLGLRAHGGTDFVDLEVTLGGVVIIAAQDSGSSALATGFPALFEGTGYRTQFDNVVIRGTNASAPPPPPPPPPPANSFSFSDNFDACTSTTDLGANWSVSGRWYCQSGKARGETALGMALARGTQGTDMTVQARVQLTSSATGSGVVARGTAGGAYYAAILVPGGRVRIVRNGTVLADVPASIGVEPSSYKLALTVSGDGPVSLTAFLSGTQVASATDASAERIASGSAGLLNGNDARTQFDDFTTSGSTASSAPPPPPPPPSTSFAVADNFDACTSTADLGAGWDIQGRWYCQSGKARGETALGMALARGTDGSDMAVEARVQLTSSATGSGVVARATLGGAYYAAIVLQSGHLQIVRNGTVLADVPASIPVEPGSVKVGLQVSGSSSVSLTATLNGTPVATATDASGNAIASGRAGLLSGSSIRTAFDDFSASSR